MSRRKTGILSFPKLLSILMIFSIAQLGLPLYAEDETDSASKTLLWPDGTRYVGGVKDGKRAGKGTIFWQDGTRFVGNFENDQRNGPGTMILPDGTVYNGYFANDVLVDPPKKGTAKQDPATLAKADNKPGKSSANASTKPDTTAKPSPLDIDTNTPDVADNLPMASVQANEVQPNISKTDVKTANTVEAIVAAEKPDIETAVTLKTVEATKIDNQATKVVAAEVEPDKELKQINAQTPLSFDANSLTVDVRKEVESTIDLWAAAWSEQSVNQYLTYYSADFAVPGKQSRAQWEGVRRSRLTKPKSIKISVAFEKIEMTAPNEVQVQFNQTYRSNLYRDSTRKQMTLIKSGANWLIQTEQSL